MAPVETELPKVTSPDAMQQVWTHSMPGIWSSQASRTGVKHLAAGLRLFIVQNIDRLLYMVK